MDLSLSEIWDAQFKTGQELRSALAENPRLKNSIKSLTERLLNRRVEGCSSCVEDAYWGLLNYYKKNNGMEKEKSKYRLRAGALLRDNVGFDASKMISQANITDGLAEFHLLSNPDCKDLFVGLPEDIGEYLAEKYPDGWIDEKAKLEAELAEQEDKKLAEEVENARKLAEEKARLKAEEAEKEAKRIAEEAEAAKKLADEKAKLEAGKANKGYKLTSADLKKVEEAKASISAGIEPDSLIETYVELGIKTERAAAIVAEAQK